MSLNNSRMTNESREKIFPPCKPIQCDFFKGKKCKSANIIHDN
jgi:hypothetical protein